MSTPRPRCTATTKAGTQCTKAAVVGGLCNVHATAFNTAITVELPEPEATPESTPTSVGFPAARHQGAKRCQTKGCGQLNGHEGHHDGRRPVRGICTTRKCWLPLGHPGNHGRPAKERVRIVDLISR